MEFVSLSQDFELVREEHLRPRVALRLGREDPGTFGKRTRARLGRGRNEIFSPIRKNRISELFREIQVGNEP